MTLSPEDRRLLTDALTPPTGHRLDAAVVTTYTLDLVALLLAPLSLAAAEAAAKSVAASESVGEAAAGSWQRLDAADPIAILEAARRYAERFTVFAQAGAIHVPATYRSILTFVEDCVVQTRAEHPDGVFHPKLWVLRFVDGSARLHHRLLVLSRNLTFDHSWDTIVRLEQDAQAENGVKGRDVADFVSRVARGAGTELSRSRSQLVADVVATLREAQFTVPEGWSSMSWLPLHGDGADSWSTLASNSPLEKGADRALVISPFLDATTVQSLTTRCREITLLARPEAIDRALTEAPSPTAYVMSEILEDGPVDASGPEMATPERPPLSGLHAKVFVLENARHTTMVLGSANATTAAFARNTEFGVRLDTPRSGVIREIWEGSSDEVMGLNRICTEYTPQLVDPRDMVIEDAEREITQFHAALALAGVTLDATPEPGDTLCVTCTVPDVAWPKTLTTTIRLLSLPAQERVLASGSKWERVAPVNLTPYVVVTSRSSTTGGVVERASVLIAHLTGAPVDRRAEAMKQLLRNRQDVLRYIAFLLGDPKLGPAEGMDLGGDVHEGFFGQPNGSGLEEVVLFEPLLRAVMAGEADALERVDVLIDELERIGQSDLLPARFQELVSIVKEAL